MLPIIFAAAAQTVAVISGGIDLSVGAVMAFTSVTAAALMKSGIEESGVVGVVVFVLLLGVAVGFINGGARRHQPRAGHHRDPRHVLRVGGCGTAGAEQPRRRSGAVVHGTRSTASVAIDWLPKALVVVLVVVAVVWLPAASLAAGPVDVRRRAATGWPHSGAAST